MTATAKVVHPRTGELLFAPRPGVEIWSTSLFYLDDAMPELRSPVGGWIINSRVVGDEAAAVVYDTIDWRWGKAQYTTIADDDIDWDRYDGGVRTGMIRRLAKLLNADMARRTVDHLPALLALSHAVENR